MPGSLGTHHFLHGLQYNTGIVIPDAKTGHPPVFSVGKCYVKTGNQVRENGYKPLVSSNDPFVTRLFLLGC